MQQRVEGFDGIEIESHGSMARRYGDDSLSLARMLRMRPIYIISPALNFIPHEHRQHFVLTKDPEGILYRLFVKGET